jgi:hypothetical protein
VVQTRNPHRISKRPHCSPRWRPALQMRPTPATQINTDRLVARTLPEPRLASRVSRHSAPRSPDQATVQLARSVSTVHTAESPARTRRDAASSPLYTARQQAERGEARRWVEQVDRVRVEIGVEVGMRRCPTAWVGVRCGSRCGCRCRCNAGPPEPSLGVRHGMACRQAGR